MKSETEIKALLSMIDNAIEKAGQANNESRFGMLTNIRCMLHYVLGHDCHAAKSFETAVRKFLDEAAGDIPSYYEDMTKQGAIEFNLDRRRN